MNKCLFLNMINNSCENKIDNRTAKEKFFSKDSLLTVLFVLAGAIIGLGYHYFFGINSGSNVFSSALIGGFIGFFILNRPCKSC